MPTNKKGGYQIIDVIALTYATALACVECGKPLLVINDEDNTPYFADSIKVDESDNVVIGKGGRTITIAENGTITQSGELKIDELHEHRLYLSDTNADTEINFVIYLKQNKPITTISELVEILTDRGLGYVATGHAIDSNDNAILLTYVSFESLSVEDNLTIGGFNPVSESINFELSTKLTLENFSVIDSVS